MFSRARSRLDTTNEASAITIKKSGKKNAVVSKPDASAKKSIKQKPRDTDYDYTVYFDDGIRKIDAVLVYNANEPSTYRETFIYNIRKQKLQIEVTSSILPTKKDRMFVKIHAPASLLREYIKVFGFQMKFNQEFILPENIVSSNCTETILTDTKPSRHHPDAKRAWKTISKEQPDTFTSVERSMVVFFLMQYTNFGKKNEPFKVGINYLLMKNDFIAAFPIHDGEYTWPKNYTEPLNDRQLLAKYWADFSSWNKEQPLYHIENYFGSEIAMFFAWVGFYNKMLILAGIVGVLTFLGSFYRIFVYTTLFENVCTSHIPLCPACRECTPLKLKYYCANYIMAFVMDNILSVLYAFFMAIWVCLFAEFWKREKNILNLKWNINSNLQDNYRPEFQATVRTTRIRPFTQEVELYVPTLNKCWSLSVSYVIVFAMISLVLLATFGVIVYEMSMKLFEMHPLYIQVTSSIISQLSIVSFKRVYGHLAHYLTNKEKPRTQLDFDKSYMLKIIMFAVVNNYGKLLYIAYFKGKFYTHPGNSRVRNDHTGLASEICEPGGCVVEIFIFLALNSILTPIWLCLTSYFLPIIKIWYKRLKEKRFRNIELPSWEKNFDLNATDHFSIMDELEEMVIQYGYITLMAAAFPLAAILALFYNIFIIKFCATKFVKFKRRVGVLKSTSMDVWFDVIQALTYISVVTNALYIAFTSKVIPQLYYKYTYPDNLASYFAFELSEYYITPDDDYWPNIGNITICHYVGVMTGPDDPTPYVKSGHFFTTLSYRLGFSVFFMIIVLAITAIVAYAIPDIPKKVKDYLSFSQRKQLRQSLSSSDFEDISILNTTSKRRTRKFTQFVRPPNVSVFVRSINTVTKSLI